MVIDPSGRLFGRINVIDFTLLAFVLLVAIGLLAVQSGWHRTSGQMITGEGDIEYTVLLTNLRTKQKDLFNPGKTTNITIRNAPRGEVPIEAVDVSRKQLVVPAASGRYSVIDDPTDPEAFTYRVRVRDHAEFTHEGFVAKGIKVKVGLPIELEGKNYRVAGVIIDVRPLTEAKAPSEKPAKSAS
jgi:hypothetical protein